MFGDISAAAGGRPPSTREAACRPRSGASVRVLSGGVHLPVTSVGYGRSADGEGAGINLRSAQDRLSEVPEVLFVCVHNAGRSQMAAALLHHYAAGRVQVRSAGSTPADQINPAVIAVMDEVGVDLSKEFPKPLTTEVVEAADVVVTMGCGDACPIFPGKRYLDWELPDPSGMPVEDVRPIRDRIDELVRELLDTLIGT